MQLLAGSFLVLVAAFFYSNSNWKSIEPWFLQLLAGSWFWFLLGSLVGHCELVSVQPDIFFYVSMKSLFYLFFVQGFIVVGLKFRMGGVPPFYIPLGPHILKCCLSLSPAVNTYVSYDVYYTPLQFIYILLLHVQNWKWCTWLLLAEAHPMVSTVQECSSDEALYQSNKWLHVSAKWTGAVKKIKRATVAQDGPSLYMVA